MAEKILVPLDGSELADRILARQRDLFAGREVVLLTVVPAHLLTIDHPPNKNPLTLARKHLSEKTAELAAAGIAATPRLEVGDAATKIVAYAREHDVALVVMSTHGRSGIARMVRGSVAERVLRHSPSPVLLSNPFVLDAKVEQTFRRILVPLDGSEMAAEIIPLVVDLARKHGSEVILYYSLPVILQPDPFVVVSPLLDEKDGHEVLRRFEERFYDIPVRRVVGWGEPATGILDLAAREPIDLIAMTTHGRSGPSRWFFGSTAEQIVRHATCPLLVKRTSGPTSARAIHEEEHARAS